MTGATLCLKTVPRYKRCQPRKPFTLAEVAFWFRLRYASHSGAWGKLMWDRKPTALFERRASRMIHAWWGTAAAGMALLLLFPPVAASAELSMRFLDVGQGDSTLIQTTVRAPKMTRGFFR
jgi:beta-lactamase superfamily II metal-dependent hydrolase